VDPARGAAPLAVERDPRPAQAGLLGAAVELAAQRPAGLRDILLDPSALGRGYFEPAAVTTLLDRHAAGADGDAKRIYALLMLELWHREFVDAPTLALQEAA
jgi:asparagine synthase (glutamine-hydrolysing)